MSMDASNFKKGLKGLGSVVEKAALRAVDIAGLAMLGDAHQLCPVDTGFLQSTATDVPAAVVGQSIKKVIGFNADYAAAVHENLTAHHKEGQAKYLEEAMRRGMPKVEDFVIKAIKEAAH
jgi:hypothetical protein